MWDWIPWRKKDDPPFGSADKLDFAELIREAKRAATEAWGLHGEDVKISFELPVATKRDSQGRTRIYTEHWPVMRVEFTCKK